MNAIISSNNLAVETKSIWNHIITLSNVFISLRNNVNDTVSFEETRATIKTILKDSHEYLLEKTSERNSYFVLFALVAHTDEKMLQITQLHPTHQWSSLQQELFNTTDAGTLFYDYIDYFRGRNDIPLIIYEVFYFCLKDGFKGSKVLEPDVCAAYTSELKAHIPVDNFPSIADRTDFKRRAKKRIPIYFYYLAILLSVFLYRLLLELIPFQVEI